MFGLNSTECYFEISENNQGEWKADFKAGNNKIIFSSEAYTSKEAAENAIEKFKDEASKAEIKEVA